MVCIAEQELKRVSPHGQRDRCFGLSRSEVQMIEVIWYGQVQRRQLGVDQEMVVAGIRLVDARRRHAHIDETEANGRILRKHRPILQTDEVDPGVSRRRRPDEDTDLDARRHDRRSVRNVILVSEE